MPRTIGFSHVGTDTVAPPLILIEWQLPGGTQYLSSGTSVVWNGHTWEGNRISGVPSFETAVLDGERRDFGDIEIVFDNFANDGSANFPFHALDAAQVFEDRLAIFLLLQPNGSKWRGVVARLQLAPKLFR